MNCLLFLTFLWISKIKEYQGGYTELSANHTGFSSSKSPPRGTQINLDWNKHQGTLMKAEWAGRDTTFLIGCFIQFLLNISDWHDIPEGFCWGNCPGLLYSRMDGPAIFLSHTETEDLGRSVLKLYGFFWPGRKFSSLGNYWGYLCTGYCCLVASVLFFYSI